MILKSRLSLIYRRNIRKSVSLSLSLSLSALVTLYLLLPACVCIVLSFCLSEFHLEKHTHTHTVYLLTFLSLCPSLSTFSLLLSFPFISFRFVSFRFIYDSTGVLHQPDNNNASNRCLRLSLSVKVSDGYVSRHPFHRQVAHQRPFKG